MGIWGFTVTPFWQGEEQWGFRALVKPRLLSPFGGTKRTMKNPLGEQDLKIYLVPISSGESRCILKPYLADTLMAEAVSPPPTAWSRAALLVAPAGTFLLRERNSRYIALGED